MDNVPVVDLKGALERLEGDEELWREIRDIWLEDAQGLADAVVQACRDRDTEQLRRKAHALKGASANVGANQVAAAAREIELGAPDQKWDELDAASDRLIAVVKKTILELEAGK